MTYQLATILSCVLLPLFGWVGTWLAKRTIYRPITSEEGVQRDEKQERDKVKGIREKSVRSMFTVYGAIVVILFLAAALAQPMQKVRAALWPTITPTLTMTASPTSTRTPSRTPAPSRTPTLTVTGDAGNFLTTISNVGTVTRTPPASLPGGSSSQVYITRVPVTVVVVRTQIVYVTQINYVPLTVPVTVVVTATNTPLPSTESATPSPTVIYPETETGTPSPTFTFTPTPTFTGTPTP